jgi:hypothetical protein
MRLKIKVTKEVLRKSAYCTGRAWENCAISVAICDVFPIADVMNEEIRIGGLPYISLPQKARDFILEFDKTILLTKPAPNNARTGI